MGNSPLTVCIHQAWEKQTVQVVLPDGQVLFLPHPLTAATLMESHPYHFVCQGSPSLLEQRLPMDAKLESGELYYLIPVPPSEFPVPKAPLPSTPPSANHYGGGGGMSPKVASCLTEKIPKSDTDSFVSDRSGSFSRLKLGPQQCLINLLVFRQSVASVMPEESLKGASRRIRKTQGSGDGAILSGGQDDGTDDVLGSEFKRGDRFQPHLSALLASGNQMSRLESRQYRISRGKSSKLGLSWRPELPSILEHRPWIDLKSMTCVNDFSVSMLTALASAPRSAAIPSTQPISSPKLPSPILSSPGSPAPTLRLFQELDRPDRSASLTPTQTSPAPPRISSSPWRVPSSPSRVPSSPSRVPSSPSRVPSSPSRVPSSPSRVPRSPSRVPSSPSRASSAPTSSLIVGSSPLSNNTPARASTCASKFPSSPARVLNSPVHFLSSPARVPSSTMQIPSSPSRVPDSPMHFPSSPARVPTSPMHFPSTRFPPSPLQFLGSPSVFHPSPLPRVCSPAQRPGSPAIRNFQRQRFVYSA